MSYRNFRLTTDNDGIAIVTWDMPEKSMNVIDMSVMDELEAIVDAISTDDVIKGAIVTSGKESFSGGADLKMLEALNDPSEMDKVSKGDEAAVRRLFDQTSRLGGIYRQLETCGKPVVAAINGTALGGAFELALRTHVPIQPILLRGSGDALPKRGFVLQGRHPIRVSVLDPIPPESFAGLSAEALSQRVRSTMAKELGES